VTRWKVYDKDGVYIGECRGLAPEVAFGECMIGLGKNIDASSITASRMPDGTFQIVFEDTPYTLRESN
jgi:hypothetical protein